MHEDVGLCMEILAMRRFRDLSSAEESGRKLSGEELAFLVRMERAAGV